MIELEVLNVQESEVVKEQRETQCHHCGVLLKNDDDASFCSSDCKNIYKSLHESGFEDQFYELQGASKKKASKPEVPALNEVFLAHLDHESYLELHTDQLDSGERFGEFSIDGIHCSGCVSVIEQMPFLLPGVNFARVNQSSAFLTLRWHPDHVKLSEIAKWLGKFGYRIGAGVADSSSLGDGERGLLKKVGIAWAIAGNVMLLAIASYLGLIDFESGSMSQAVNGLSFVLSLISVVYVGPTFFKAAWNSIVGSIKSKSITLLHIDTPISIGILMGFAYSSWSTFVGAGHVWFDSITVLIAALVTARWLQARSLRWAREQANKNLELIPQVVRFISDEGKEFVELKDIEPGNLIEVLPGEIIPIDGLVVEGHSRINNAAWTGESLPIKKGIGQSVEAGGINLTQSLQIRASSVGSDSKLEKHLRSSIEKESKPIDKLGAWFTIGLLLIAVLTIVIWSFIDPSRIVSNVVALLVIACPCALAMSRPLTTSINTNRLSRKGIHIKSDSAFADFRRSEHIVFDKTGTLTKGDFSILATKGSEQALHYAACIEQGLNHPVAEAIAKLKGGQSYEFENREVVPGMGVRALVDGKLVKVGRPDWVLSTTDLYRSEIDPEFLEIHKAASSVLISVNQIPKAVVYLGDSVRPEARPLIDRLKKDGKELAILSGDDPAIASDVGRHLGLNAEECFGHKTPEEKENMVHHWMANGRDTVMIGDGINDASAMKMSRLGIALSGALSPGLCAADVYLSRGNIESVGLLYDVALVSERRIEIAITSSLVYNTIAAGFAVAGLIHPLLAAIAMPISSLLVLAISVWPVALLDS